MDFLIQHSIKKWAIKSPEKIAYRYLKEEVNYGDLYTAARQIASKLFQWGLEKGDRVGIFLHRSIEIPMALYGILQAGGVFVPIDPFAPAERVQQIIKDAGISIIISHEKLTDKIRSIGKNESNLKYVLGLENAEHLTVASWRELKTSEIVEIPYKLLGKDLAYIMYTSGTTGRPKGIMHSHNSGLAYARLSAELYGVTSEDRFANHAALHFDISTFGYLTMPYVGGTTIILSEAHLKMPASLASLLSNEKITIWYSVPFALIQLVERGALEKYKFSSIRWVLFGGEPIPSKWINALMKHWYAANYSNVYGPAEVNQCTYFHFNHNLPEDKPIPLGAVWENTDYLIATADGRVDKEAEEGELYIRSETMMKGYWDRKDLTSSSIYTRHINGVNEQYYKTGDLVRQNPKGHLHFIERKDHQIKIRGYRIELGAIEQTLMQHDSVAQAVAFVNKNDPARPMLMACVVCKTGIDFDPTQLLNYCSSSLPAYAVPEKIILRSSIPRTAAGKIDRKKIESSHI